MSMTARRRRVDFGEVEGRSFDLVNAPLPPAAGLTSAVEVYHEDGALSIGTDRRNPVTVRVGMLVSPALVLQLASAPSDATADIATGRRIFESVCAACHGANGRPDPANPIVQAFDPPPADLTDPLFNSREPALDWELVVKHGGQAMGLSPQMPPQSGNLSDDVQFSVLPQMRIGLTRGGHVALNLGVELPLSDQDYDYRAHLNLLWEFADGSFFQGW